MASSVILQIEKKKKEEKKTKKRLSRNHYRMGFVLRYMSSLYRDSTSPLFDINVVIINPDNNDIDSHFVNVNLEQGCQPFC